jgi:O-antigen/teichoic acid export membrane protein
LYGQNSHVAEVVRGASVVGVLKALSALLALGLSVVLARILGAEETGIYFLALSTATIAATFGRLGLDSAIIRSVSAHASTGRWTNVSSVYRAAIAIGLICSIVSAVILYFAADSVANVLFTGENLAGPIRFMAFAVVPLAVSVLVSRALQGLSCIRDSVLVSSIVPAGIALCSTSVLAYQWGVNGAIAAYVMGVTAALAYGAIAWRRELASRTPVHHSQEIASATRNLLKSSAPLLIGALLQLVIQMSGTVMLGIWADNTDVSLFAVSWRTALMINFVLIAVNTTAHPKFAELYARGDAEALALTARRANLLMTAIAAPVFLVLLVAPQLVMSVFGSEFTDGATTLQVLAIGQFVNVIMGSVGVLLVMSGHEREYRNVQLVAAGVVVALNYLLIPSQGAVGAAVGAASALIVQNILFGYFVWARLRILMLVPRSLIRRMSGEA